MAGLWEPSAGVFWSTPPVVPEPALPLSTEITIGVIVAVLVTALLKLFALYCWPKRWRVRNHLGAIGTALTLSYFAFVLPLIGGRVDSLMTMPLNEVGDFLAGAFGPVAFMWLVLGFLQQGEELRQGTEALQLQAVELRSMAEAASQQIEAQREAFEHQLDEKDRALRAVFTAKVKMVTGGTGHMSNTINLTNTGANAYGVEVSFEPPFPDWSGGYLDGIRTNSSAQFSIHIRPEDRHREGIMLVAYKDAEGRTRAESFDYSLFDDWIMIAKTQSTSG